MCTDELKLEVFDGESSLFSKNNLVAFATIDSNVLIQGGKTKLPVEIQLRHSDDELKGNTWHISVYIINRNLTFILFE
jgi:hypothetical protein